MQSKVSVEFSEQGGEADNQGQHLNSTDVSDFTEKFRKDGYVIVPHLFSKAEVREISQCFARLQKIALKLRSTTMYRGTQFVVGRQKIHRIVWVAGSEPVLRTLGSDGRITGKVSHLLGSATMDHLICQAHYKLPGDQVNFTWHQDAEHRGYGTSDWSDLNGSGSYVQTVMAVDPMTRDNGPVMILPRSHQKGFLGMNRPGVSRERMVRENLLIPVELDPGSVLFFGPYLVHGSRVNHSDKPRRIFINGFAYPGANSRVYPGDGSGYRLSVGQNSDPAQQLPEPDQMSGPKRLPA